MRLFKKDKFLDKSVHLTGKNYIEIGRNSIISQNTWLNVNKRDKKKRIILGAYDFIGRNNFFSAGELIRFGDFVITSVNCCFIGAKHDYSNPFVPYMCSGTDSDSVIQIGTNCFVGANVTIIDNVSIGYGSIIGANVILRNITIPPFSLVVGYDAPKVIKRYSFYTNSWKRMSMWTMRDEEMLISEAAYVEKIFDNIENLYLPVKAAGKSFGDLNE